GRGKYLEAAAGTPTRQLFTLARRGLRLELRGAFQEAVETRRPVVREPIPVEVDDRVQNIRLAVEPLGNPDSDPLFLVLFSDIGVTETRGEAAVAAPATGNAAVEPLERELRDTRDRLQTTVEEYETALEELKAANEEMVSMNEELQSTNEELETSKEELNVKIEQVDQANADLRNLFDSTQIATIFLDRHLVVRSFTPASSAIFNLISTDRGRPLTDIVSN